jgi:hypothetical protein
MNYHEIPGVTLKMIIDSGIIKPETKVYASLNHQITGNINGDGSITLFFDHQPKTFPFPSGAARAIVKTSINGWLFWKILDCDQYKELSYFKNEYLKNLEQNKSTL